MEKTIYWDSGRKELGIETWISIRNWALPFGINFWQYDDLDTKTLYRTTGATFKFLCFGVSFEFFNWRKEDE